MAIWHWALSNFTLHCNHDQRNCMKNFVRKQDDMLKQLRFRFTTFSNINWDKYEQSIYLFEVAQNLVFFKILWIPHGSHLKHHLWLFALSPSISSLGLGGLKLISIKMRSYEKEQHVLASMKVWILLFFQSQDNKTKVVLSGSTRKVQKF